jgi:hypothetical protein
MSRCPLLVECQTSVSRGESTDKGQRGAVVYRLAEQDPKLLSAVYYNITQGLCVRRADRLQFERIG